MGQSSRGGTAEDLFLDGDAAALVDREGLIVGWTQAAVELSGHSAQETLGRPARSLLADPDAWERLVASASAPSWQGNIALRHRTGQVIDTAVRVLPLESAGVSCLVLAEPDAVSKTRERDRALVDGLFSQDRIGLVLLDTDLTVIRDNFRARGVVAPAEGARLDDILVPSDAHLLDGRLRQVLETGEPMVNVEQGARLRSAPERERFVVVTAFRLREPGGRPLGVAVGFTDVTTENRARRRLALLHSAAGIGTSLDLIRTAEELADVLVPNLAHMASVDLVEVVLSGDEPRVIPPGEAPEAVLYRAAGARKGGRWPRETYPPGSSVKVDPDTPQGRILYQGGAILTPRLSEFKAQVGSAGELARMFIPDEAHSSLAVPLFARGRLLGLVVMWRTSQEATFNEDDTSLAEEIISRAALGVDNARRYTREHNTAVTLQRSLLPRPVVETVAAETAGTYLPAVGRAGVGGDWFDVIPLSSSRVALAIGGVVGHGLKATATMARMRTAVRALSDLDLTPEDLLLHLDDLVVQLAGEGPPADGTAGENALGSSCLYAVYDPVARRCVLANAKCPTPVVVGPRGGTATFLDVPTSPALGTETLPFEPVEIEMEPGSVLACYTDGLVERRDGRQLEMERVRQELERRCDPDRPLAEIGREVLTALAPDPPAEDVVLLLARLGAVDDTDTAAWELPADPAVVSQARELASVQLTAWGLEELSFTTELVVSELVTNAIRYADGPVTLRVTRERVLICEVSDHSSTQPRPRRARSTDEGGRGLFMVAQLTQRWGSRYTASGKTIWTEQPLDTTLTTA
ncbi:SpoIIE family protein phosphatase [Wenjunlia tyrosinilytica]|uniref:PAS domain-containing protein n=1 Tax=Wenjunlia tyrosinilytica TaxID=1544741 RepID=A0A917ZRV9_9ACTN|nr:SpoIIE family protein phosphatase [Wenjunlia tyrosinilytica]GGO91678.1 hypothetical protein GCM10012280_40110 [Wenjunlia tyrosinilytica]